MFMNSSPICGEDFCDLCGDCLYCYGDISCHCLNDMKHFWVEYVKNIKEAEKIAKKYNAKFEKI